MNLRLLILAGCAVGLLWWYRSRQANGTMSIMSGGGTTTGNAADAAGLPSSAAEDTYTVTNGTTAPFDLPADLPDLGPVSGDPGTGGRETFLN